MWPHWPSDWTVPTHVYPNDYERRGIDRITVHFSDPGTESIYEGQEFIFFEAYTAFTEHWPSTPSFDKPIRFHDPYFDTVVVMDFRLDPIFRSYSEEAYLWNIAIRVVNHLFVPYIRGHGCQSSSAQILVHTKDGTSI